MLTCIVLLSLCLHVISGSLSDSENLLNVTIPLKEAQRPPLGGSLTLPCFFEDHSAQDPGAPLSHRIKWSIITKEKSTTILVVMEGKMRISNNYLGRVHLVGYPMTPTDASIRISGLRSSDSGFYRCEVQHEMEDSHDFVYVDVQGIVFHYRAIMGRYSLTFEKAEVACSHSSAVVASLEQLQAAFDDGLHQCDAGWLSDHTVRYPIHDLHANCAGGSELPGIRTYGVRDLKETYDVYCFAEKMIGRVFYTASDEKYSYGDAIKACYNQAAVLATTGQLYLAWQDGMDVCNAGWLMDRSVRYPIITPRSQCGGGRLGVQTVYVHANQTGYPHPESLYDAFCYKEYPEEEEEDYSEFRIDTDSEASGDEDRFTIVDLNYAEGTGVVFHYRKPSRRYDFTFIEAQMACIHMGSSIATPQQLEAAYKAGYHQCDAGWVLDQTSRYPIIYPRAECAGNLGNLPGVRSYGLRPANEKYDVYCYIGGIDGEVFHVGSQDGFNFTEAASRCEEENAKLASTAELYAAWKVGFDKCRAGWLLDGSVRYPINKPSDVCGGGIKGVHTVYTDNSQTAFPDSTARYDAYCYRESTSGSGSEDSGSGSGGQSGDEGTSEDPSVSGDTGSTDNSGSSTSGEGSDTDGDSSESTSGSGSEDSGSGSGGQSGDEGTSEDPSVSGDTGSTDNSGSSTSGEGSDTDGDSSESTSGSGSEDSGSGSGGQSGDEGTSEDPSVSGDTGSTDNSGSSTSGEGSDTDGDSSESTSGSGSEDSGSGSGGQSGDEGTSEDPSVSGDTGSTDNSGSSTSGEGSDTDGDSSESTSGSGSEDSGSGSGGQSGDEGTSEDPSVSGDTGSTDNSGSSTSGEGSDTDGDSSESTSGSGSEDSGSGSGGQSGDEGTSEDPSVSGDTGSTDNSGSSTSGEGSDTDGDSSESTSGSGSEDSGSGSGGQSGDEGTSEDPSVSGDTGSTDNSGSSTSGEGSDTDGDSSGDCNPCEPNPCGAASCSVKDGVAICQRMDVCLSNPCTNGATCMETPDSYKCLCLPGYGGEHCQLDDHQCEEGWTKFQGNCYLYVPENETWVDAELRCRNLNSHLVTIISPEEQTFVNANVQKAQWIGLHDKIIQNDFHWIDGTPLQYVSWMQGQPSKGGCPNDDCVAMVNGEWDDMPCDNQLTYTCKKSSVSCCSPPEVENAYMFGKKKDYYPINAIIRYQCNSGFIQYHHPVIHCKSDGHWETPQVQCIDGYNRQRRSAPARFTDKEKEEFMNLV